MVGCAGTRPNIKIPAQQPRPKPMLHRPQVALVLGAGGARGYAHLGVLQVLHEAHIPIDLIVGASAGSFVGSLYADNTDPKKTYDIMMKAGFWDLADIGNLPNAQGIIEGYHFQKFLMQHMKAHWFRQLKIKLVTAATNLKTGKTYVIQAGPVPPAVLASAAVPAAVVPQHLYGHVLTDGGVTDPVPVALAKKFHPKIIIAVNIGQVLRPVIPRTSYGIYNRAYAIIFNRLTTLSLKGADVVIRPNVGDVNTFNMDDKYQMYLAGYRAAKAALPTIKQRLREAYIDLKK